MTLVCLRNCNERLVPLMKSSPFLVESAAGDSRYTHLFALISEDDDSYTLQVRLHNKVSPENAAWGEEITDSFETACLLVAALAAEFSIAKGCIRIEIRMHKATDGTRH